MGRIVDKFIGELAAQLGERKVKIELSEAARAYLAKKGYDPLNGARPLGRVIADEVKRPLTDELLFGKLSSGGGTVHVGADGDKLTFSFDCTPADGLIAPRSTPLMDAPSSDPWKLQQVGVESGRRERERRGRAVAHVDDRVVGRVAAHGRRGQRVALRSRRRTSRTVPAGTFRHFGA